jgi:hypothetical protein
MSKKSCALYPEAPNGESSRMYRDLLERIKDRPMVNWLYATYIVAGKAGMDQAGIEQNRQGEHKMDDYLRFINYADMEREMSNRFLAAQQLGAEDNNGNATDFTNAEDALTKADNFNSSHSALTATVVQRGDVFNIVVAEKNSRTHTYEDTVKTNLKAWEVYKQAFNAVGVDLTNVPQEVQNIVNAMNGNLASYLNGLSGRHISNMYKQDAMILFSLSPNSPHVQRVINAFGSIEKAAEALSDFNHNNITLTNGQQTLLMRAVNDAKKFNGIDMNALEAQTQQITKSILKNSTEQDVKNALHVLNKKYKIDINEIHRTSEEIRSLSDAAAESAVLLQRQIRELEKEKGNNAEGKRVEGILNSLMKELANKKYYSGTLRFLNEAASQVAEIDNMLQSIPQTGTEIEKAFATAKILQDINSLRDQYYTIVDALSNEALKIDESISKNDIDNIRQSAKKLKDFFDKKQLLLHELAEGTMTNLLLEIVGDKAPDGQSIINLVKMASADSSMTNYLYSVGRATNPIIGAMGSIIRNAQDSRDGKINAITRRISRATDKLYKAGYDSAFMYEDDGHIVSDIDWESYKDARKAAIKSFYAQGLKDFDLKQAIENWEEQNTEDRVVDHTAQRAERVPNANYRKMDDFQEGWSQEQREYYSEMMELKGELGTLLPAYAQKQYLPPQVRREFLDAIKDGDIKKALKNKAQDFYKVREDDTDYAMNGIIDGDEYQITDGSFDNTPLRQIPIFFVNRVENGELLKNFSTGLQALAGTAVNYEAMNEIKDVVEFIGDFVKGQFSKDIKSKADVVQNKEVRVFKDLWKRGKNTTTADIIEGFISQHIYGQKMNPNENKTLTKIFSNILGYNSFRTLATNVKGAFANYLMGEFQMMIEAGAGEFYGFKDYAWAHSKLFGSAGVAGDMMELLSNNMSHKSTLMREMFDPLQENYSDKSHKKYYTNMFQQMLSKDCSFIGYSSGEYLIHYVNMYSVLHNKKVKLNGQKISLYDAFEVTDKQDGNAELILKQGVTDLDGNAITSDYIDQVRKTIRYVNQSTHGAMNAEDKGLIHQRILGRMAMNFRQWMVEHYSRRFRKRHFDASLGMDREGYWISLWKGLANDDTKDAWHNDQKWNAIGMFMKDLYTFMLRSESQWHNLDEMQRHNIHRVRTEMLMYVAMLGLSFALGEPDEHKKDVWRRWWIYQTKRAILDTEASMPHPKAITNLISIFQSPMASINFMSSLFYVFYGLFNGDLFEEIQSGDHKGENRYLRNVLKYDLPFFKDWEQMQRLGEDDTIFRVFEASPNGK